MRGDVAIEFLLRQVLREKATARRPRRSADKRRIIADQIEAAAVDFQVAAQLDVPGRGAAGQRVVQLQALWVALPPVDGFKILARLNELADQLPLAQRQPRGVKGHE